MKKLFLLLEDYQENIILKGNIYLDEMYYKIKKSDLKMKTQYKELTGLSENQICIGVAKTSGKVYAKVEGVRKINKERTITTFEKHIENKSHLIHDDEKSHIELVKRLSLTEEIYKSKDLKKLKDEDNPLDPINKTILFLKQFLDSHPGFNREEIQDYINLFVFMTNEAGEPIEKVKKILEISIVTYISIKYREYYAKKSIFK